MAASANKVLEDWLWSCSSPLSSLHQSPRIPPPSAREIAESWGIIRDSIQKGIMEPHHITALKKLSDYRNTLHVAEPQARLLLKLLSQTHSSFLGPPMALAILILSVWIRKSPKPLPSVKPLFESLVEINLKIVNESAGKLDFAPEMVLLLGSLSSVATLSSNAKTLCQEKVAGLMDVQRETILMASRDRISKALAGAGYALYSSSELSVFRSIFVCLLRLLNEESCCVESGLMLLHLTEWLTMQRNISGKVSVIVAELVQAVEDGSFNLAFSATMAAGGILRSTGNRNPQNLSEWKPSLEAILFRVAERVLQGLTITLDIEMVSRHVFDGEFDARTKLFLQCITMAVSRCRGNVAFNSGVFMCLVLSLITEAFRFRDIYPPIAAGSLKELSIKVESAVFGDSGLITRALCSQYCLASVHLKQLAHQLMWRYSDQLYRRHRVCMVFLKNIENRQRFRVLLEKITAAVFSMVVTFFSSATKHVSSLVGADALYEEVSVLSLGALSCVECFRREQVADYRDMIKNAVSCVSQSATACTALVRTIPSYSEVVQCPDASNFGLQDYYWDKDEVQTARIHFYLRILPPCVEKIPAKGFENEIAPLMYLYLHHSDQNVIRASHAVFVAVMSAKQPGLKSPQTSHDDTVSLKEQLVVYYLERALEAYPQLTPFEALGSGVVALVEHLPAGSPAIHFCVDGLVRKFKQLYDSEFPANSTKHEERWQESESAKNLRLLLQHLILVIDIQVLPDLLRLLAQLTIELPASLRDTALGDMFDLVSGSDDVVRKPTLVPWLQSLSYICSHKNAEDLKRKNQANAAKANVTDEQSSRGIRKVIASSMNASRL